MASNAETADPDQSLGPKSGHVVTRPGDMASTGTPHARKISASSITSKGNFSRPIRPSLNIATDRAPSRSRSPLPDPQTALPCTRFPQENSEMSFQFNGSREFAESANMSTSQIAAQAAMQNQQMQQAHLRKRSQTIPIHEEVTNIILPRGPRTPLAGTFNSVLGSRDGPSQMYSNGLLGPAAATTAAAAAYPRLPSPVPSGLGELRRMEKGRRKLFSKPKAIVLVKEKDPDPRTRALPSPNKLSLANPFLRTAYAPPTAIASSTNSSVVSLPPTNSFVVLPETSVRTIQTAEEKSGRHYFLPRPRRAKENHNLDHPHLALNLSSAHSNSRPVDPAAPQAMYDFTPTSPGVSGNAFAKSMSGLDLRHGGRALREKRREGKASAAAAAASAAAQARTDSLDNLRPPPSLSDWSGQTSQYSERGFSRHTPRGSGGSVGGLLPTTPIHELTGFGIPNLTADDSWPLLKTKVVKLFEGERLQQPFEDLNRLVAVHIQKALATQATSTLLEDLADLLLTGFQSLSARIQETHVLIAIKEMWDFVFGILVPSLQAIFLPLQLELTGNGQMISKSQAIAFWTHQPDLSILLSPSPGGVNPGMDEAEAALDIRATVLMYFRDVVLLSRFDTLREHFGRLSFDSFNTLTGYEPGSNATGVTPQGGFPMDTEPHLTSGGPLSFEISSTFDSQGSTLLDELSQGNRSRAISNVSSTGFYSNPESEEILSTNQHLRHARNRSTGTTASTSLGLMTPGTTLRSAHAARARTHSDASANNEADGRIVAEMVSRVLQCLSVTASLRTDDEAQQQVEELRELVRSNWLGKGRTGRNRRGFIGAKSKAPSHSQRVADAYSQIPGKLAISMEA